jgi:hypothetical protein
MQATTRGEPSQHLTLRISCHPQCIKTNSGIAFG